MHYATDKIYARIFFSEPGEEGQGTHNHLHISPAAMNLFRFTTNHETNAEETVISHARCEHLCHKKYLKVNKDTHLFAGENNINNKKHKA